MTPSAPSERGGRSKWNPLFCHYARANDHSPETQANVDAGQMWRFVVWVERLRVRFDKGAEPSSRWPMPPGPEWPRFVSRYASRRRAIARSIRQVLNRLAMNCPKCHHEFKPTPTQLAKEMRGIKSPARSEASRKNGSAPVKPGSKPRGRPKKTEAANAKKPRPRKPKTP